MLSAGGFDTRYRSWGTRGSQVVLVPGAFETADTARKAGASGGDDNDMVFILPAVSLGGCGEPSMIVV